jgi:hypothetical protein
MTNFELLSIVIAIFALIFSGVGLFFNGIQTRKAAKAYILDQQLSLGNSTIHFTSRFMDLVKDGEPIEKLDDDKWAYRFWTLQAAEFYFFHRQMLPKFMYTLWVIDLAKLYTQGGGKKAWKSHYKYLETYSIGYEEMTDFFQKIYHIAQTTASLNERNKEISSFVDQWILSNSRSIKV